MANHKTALKVFNNETSPQYIDRCFNIVTRNATSHPNISGFYNSYLPFTFYESGFKKCQETHKKFKYHFVMYSISVLANTKDQSTFFGVSNRFLSLLLSPTKTEMMEHAVSFLEEKLENIGQENNCLIIDENKDSLSGNKVFLEKKQDEKSEAIHLQQSKCSIFHQKAKKIFDSVKKAVDVNLKSPKSLIENPLYSPSLASYFLDNWIGLAPLRTVFLLVDPESLKFIQNMLVSST